ncbi:hypothetical protein EVAR_16486_1 [Eumeta japonica]|uniref:Uncharacterized protein n=1 Tax=Eumeta variegata TaxID=151549 RepID=A0A4C1UM11_EUMVA|nr:hypothetical protein EVAR_16486_1 [Eumeta japonica]
MRGKLQRAPVIKLFGNPIRAVASATVLGVVLNASLSSAQQAASIVERESRCSGKLYRVSAASSGHVCGARYAIKGPKIILLTKAYRSVSTAALLVLAGVFLPTDLEVTLAGRLDLARLEATKVEIRARKKGL